MFHKLFGNTQIQFNYNIYSEFRGQCMINNLGIILLVHDMSIDRVVK